MLVFGLLMTTIYGSAGNQARELLTGSSGDDLIYPLGGWDVIDGGEGSDTVFILTKASDWKLLTYGELTYVDAVSAASAAANRATLINVEKIQFLDRVIELETNDIFPGRPGYDVFDGADGFDQVVYQAPLTNYSIRKAGVNWLVTDKVGTDDIDQLKSIERIVFSDVNIALDFDGVGGEVARLFVTLFGQRVAVDESSRKILGMIIRGVDQGEFSLINVAEFAFDSGIIQSISGATNLETTLAFIYHNVTNKTASANDLLYLRGLIDSGEYTLASLTQTASSIVDLVGVFPLGIPYGG
jgi:hypothetical protein